jgi:hypothetical protein
MLTVLLSWRRPAGKRVLRRALVLLPAVARAAVARTAVARAAVRAWHCAARRSLRRGVRKRRAGETLARALLPPVHRAGLACPLTALLSRAEAAARPGFGVGCRLSGPAP